MHVYSEWITNFGDINPETPGKVFKCIHFGGHTSTRYSDGNSLTNIWEYTNVMGELIPKDPNTPFSEVVVKYQCRDSTTFSILQSIVEEPRSFKIIHFDGEDFEEGEDA